jgi:MFS family permease
MRFRGLWRQPDFIKLWSGQTISLFGTGLGALPFAAIFLLDASVMDMALLGAAGLVPALLFGLVAGAWVDRLKRRPVLIVANLGRAILLGTVIIAAVFDVLRMEHLLLVAFLAGTFEIFFDLAYLAYLPSLVERDQILEGNSKLTASASVAEAGSFSVGGWIVQIFSATAAVVVDALSYLVSAFLFAAIRKAEPEPEASVEQPSIVREIREGLSTLFHQPVLRALGLSNISMDFGSGMIGSVILLYVIRDLGFEPGVVGLIFAVGGVTSLMGATLAQPLTRRFGMGPAMIAGVAVFAVSTVFIPLAQGATLAGAMLLIAQQILGDPGYTVHEINQTSLRQIVTPGRLLGRVSSGMRFSGLTATLCGTLAAGFIGQAFGLRAALFTAVGAEVIAVLLLYFSPVRSVRRAELHEAEPVTV